MLHHRFFSQARARPDATALWIQGAAWSYANLAELALCVGATLAKDVDAHPPAQATRVALLMEKSAVAFATVLGALASSNTYVPLSVRASNARNVQILREAGCARLVVDAASYENLKPELDQCPPMQVLICEQRGEPGSAEVLVREAQSGAPAPADPAALERCLWQQAPERWAYIIFTSGSTGRPKGVPVRHESICACVESFSTCLALQPEDRLAQFADLAFDVSVGDMFTAWHCGAAVFAPEYRAVASKRFVTQHQLTVWSSVPTIAADLRALGQLGAGAFPSLRLTYFCGEALSDDLARAWAQAAPNSAVYNIYGPTEAAVFATWHRFDRNQARTGGAGTVPIGEPLPTVRTHVDGVASPSQENDVGELLLSGVQVTDGYLNNDTAAAQSFVQREVDGVISTWYRTGDMVSRGAHGGLTYRGRRDRQLKVRGTRVELQEVEATLTQLLGGMPSAVLPYRFREGCCQSLAAVYVGPSQAEDALRERCAKVLPAHLVPERFLVQEALPHNVNGKIDYLALQQLVDALA